ncbi:AAA family ATPase [Nocardia sp. NBC_00881]|uniref:AAA family ATPase n=1 Tax=Nocardia sp. NBC_00881 TaxID=2975995 RepID=UPI003865DCDC|nr:AAA family ATPase [Nocardia sp. NBC_00881]
MPEFDMVNTRRRPVIGIVSGPPGSGKSTLAHALATDIGVPAIIRDEIKQGMVAGAAPTSNTGYEDLNIPVLHIFFDVLTLLARSGVSAVAEAAFQDKLWFYNRFPVVVQ